MLNRKNRIIEVLGMLGFALASCQSEPTIEDTLSSGRIYLGATVENTVMSRGAYVLTKPERNNPLDVAVWATSYDSPRHYPDEGLNGVNSENVAIHTTAHFTNWHEQLLNDVVYPKEGGKTIYFIGLHPADGWITSTEGEAAGRFAVKTFSGCEDVMFAPEISGEYAENVVNQKWPTFRFRHLLTWLRVCVMAENDDVAGAWGKSKVLESRVSSKYQ